MGHQKWGLKLEHTNAVSGTCCPSLFILIQSLPIYMPTLDTNFRLISLDVFKHKMYLYLAFAFLLIVC